MARSTLLLGLALVGLLAGCPAPTDSTSSPGGGPPGGGPGGPPGGGAGGPGGGPGGPGGGPGGSGDGAVLLDLSEMTAQKTQEEVAAGDHVTVSGEVVGECTGLARIDIIPGTQPGGGGGPGAKGGPSPLTTLDLEGSGAFAVLVPKGEEVMINALCDMDNDGKIVLGTDKLARGEVLGALDADKEGLTLDLSQGPGGPMGGAGGPEGGAGGPPPEGGAGGPPPDGAGGPPGGKAGKGGKGGKAGPPPEGGGAPPAGEAAAGG